MVLNLQWLNLHTTKFNTKTQWSDVNTVLLVWQLQKHKTSGISMDPDYAYKGDPVGTRYGTHHDEKYLSLLNNNKIAISKARADYLI